MATALDAWFSREILIYEEALVRYLKHTWHHRDDVFDLRQEVYMRVYEAAAQERPRSPKSFLFATARNLMADRLRRSRVISIEARADLESLNVLVDEMSPEHCASAQEDLRTLAWALEQLPPRCREVVWLRRVENLSQREVAARLGICETVVEKHTAKAMRRFADAFFGERGAELDKIRSTSRKERNAQPNRKVVRWR
ncbi:MAG: RNA polymerase sigma factor [Steroidobacteraceae bacterium]